jgi:outer membrane protein TolC
LAGEADAQMELTLARRNTIALVRKLHAEIMSYDAQLALGRDVIEQRQKLRTLVQGRLDLHAATLLDQSLSDIDYLDAMTELAKLEVQRRAAYDELLIQLGLPAGTSITLAPSGQGCAAPSDAASLADLAQKANPRSHLYHAQLYATEAEHRQKTLALFPWFDYFQVGYGFAGNSNPSYISFQVQLTLPLLDWKRADRRALTARHEGLLERIHADDRELTDLVLRTTAAQAEQAALVQRYRDAAGVVESGLTHLRQAMAQGQITNLFEIVQLQTRLLATQRSAMRAELDCRLYRIELDRLTSAGQAN